MAEEPEIFLMQIAFDFGTINRFFGAGLPGLADLMLPPPDSWPRPLPADVGALTTLFFSTGDFLTKGALILEQLVLDFNLA